MLCLPEIMPCLSKLVWNHAMSFSPVAAICFTLQTSSSRQTLQTGAQIFWINRSWPTGHHWWRHGDRSSSGLDAGSVQVWSHCCGCDMRQWSCLHRKCLQQCSPCPESVQSWRCKSFVCWWSFRIFVKGYVTVSMILLLLSFGCFFFPPFFFFISNITAPFYLFFKSSDYCLFCV